MGTDKQQDGKPACHAIGIGDVALMSTLELRAGGEEVFRVTEAGELVSHGKYITYNDAALANCLRDWIEQVCGRDVRRPSHNGDTPNE